MCAVASLCMRVYTCVCVNQSAIDESYGSEGGKSGKKERRNKISVPVLTPRVMVVKVRQHSLVKWGHYFLCDSRAISVGLCTPRCNWWQWARAPGPQGRNSCVSLSEVPPQTAGDGQASKDAGYFSLQKMLVCRRACSLHDKWGTI